MELSNVVDTSVKAFTLLNSSFEKLKKLNRSVSRIRRDLNLITATVRKHSMVEEESLQSWISDLTYIQCRCQDFVAYYNLRYVQGPDKWTGALFFVMDRLKGPSSELLEDLEAIENLVIKCKFRVDNYSPPAGAPVPTTIHDHDTYQHPRVADPEGLQAPLNELKHVLIGGEETSKNLQVIAIYGPGGSGKTTLAKAAFDHAKITKKFEYVAWVKASRKLTNILGDIVEQLGIKKPPPSVDLPAYLRGILKGKRYLVGIDELENSKYWREPFFAFPDNSDGSRIILTTTKQAVARFCHVGFPMFRMPQLGKESARALLVKTAFGEDEYPSSLEPILEEIVEICEQLPAAICWMGDYMRSTKGWQRAVRRNVCKTIGKLMFTERRGTFRGLNHILNRSFMSLDYRMRACLLTLSSFPSGYIIKCKNLTRRWFSEDLIEVQSAAPEIIKALIDHHFITPVEVSNSGDVKKFKVVPIVRHFLREKARNYITWVGIGAGQGEELIYVTRLAIHNGSSDSPSIRKEIDISHVRLVTVYGKASRALDLSVCRYLRVLILENLEGLTDECLKNLCKTQMIRFISLRDNRNLSKLPEDVLTMKLLESLDLRGTMIASLPMDVFLLPRLKHLFGEFAVIWSKVPADKVCRLETLSGLLVNQSAEFLKFLSEIRTVRKVKVLSSESAPTDQVKQEIVKSLAGYLRNLQLMPDESVGSLTVDFGVHDLGFLNMLPSNYRIKMVKLCGTLDTLPEFVTFDKLTHLQLYLPGRGIWDLFPQLELLRYLECLKLVARPATDTSSSGEQAPVPDQIVFSSGKFTTLVRLCLVSTRMPKIVFKEKSVAWLESLHLHFNECSGFEGFSHPPKLEEVLIPSDSPHLDDLAKQLLLHPRRPDLLRSHKVRQEGCATSAN